MTRVGHLKFSKIFNKRIASFYFTGTALDSNQRGVSLIPNVWEIKHHFRNVPWRLFHYELELRWKIWTPLLSSRSEPWWLHCIYEWPSVTSGAGRVADVNTRRIRGWKQRITFDHHQCGSPVMRCQELTSGLSFPLSFFRHIGSAHQNIRLLCLWHCSSPSNGDQYRPGSQINSNRRNLTRDKNNSSHLLVIKFSHREETEFWIDELSKCSLSQLQTSHLYKLFEKSMEKN
jgi:hypothetical protein